uniref:Putative secreted protein n=1 Tax=Anopheles triannulatus TaxID=58253 RepID=A0A2M4B6K8_9DIPT
MLMLLILLLILLLLKMLGSRETTTAHNRPTCTTLAHQLNLSDSLSHAQPVPREANTRDSTFGRAKEG